MKKCFHFTKNRFLKSILKQGLQPKFGANCSIIGDGNGEKISYSIEQDKAVQMFMALYEIYYRIADGRVKEESYDEIGREAISDLQNSESFEEWEEPGVYLMFDGDYIENANNDESKPHDSYTDKTIPSEQLKVCVIKNKKTGEIFSSKYDVVCFWIAKSNNKRFSFYCMDYKERINEFKSEEFEMDYIELSKFCEMYPEKLEEKKVDFTEDKMATQGTAVREITVSEVGDLAKSTPQSIKKEAINAVTRLKERSRGGQSYDDK